MNLLDNHLEQISLSAATIAALPFPPPKAFTEALVNPHDITALIRDTEAHERILFTAASDKGTSTINSSSFRRSIHHTNRNKGDLLSGASNVIRPPRKNTAVATLLGVELGERLRKEGTQDSKERGEVDVELLLKGAEKLCSI
ncbi:MAG: hypothetical protein Q9167_002206 [Letrouitia subvulpina]